MKDTKTVYHYGGGGVGFAGWLFLLFLGLKLTGYIAWSWWWVTAPLWVPLAIGFTVMLSMLFFIAIFTAIGGFKD